MALRDSWFCPMGECVLHVCRLPGPWVPLRAHTPLLRLRCLAEMPDLRQPHSSPGRGHRARPRASEGATQLRDVLLSTAGVLCGGTAEQQGWATTGSAASAAKTKEQNKEAPRPAGPAAVWLLVQRGDRGCLVVFRAYLELPSLKSSAHNSLQCFAQRFEAGRGAWPPPPPNRSSSS